MFSFELDSHKFVVCQREQHVLTQQGQNSDIFTYNSHKTSTALFFVVIVITYFCQWSLAMECNSFRK